MKYEDEKGLGNASHTLGYVGIGIFVRYEYNNIYMKMMLNKESIP